MTTHVREEVHTVIATEDLSGSQYKVITLAGTIAQAADKARYAGVQRTNVTSGGHASAVYDGVTKALVGGAVTTPGWPLKIANSGFLVACASGDQGIARMSQNAAAASGDLTQVFISALPHLWGG